MAQTTRKTLEQLIGEDPASRARLGRAAGAGAVGLLAALMGGRRRGRRGMRGALVAGGLSVLGQVAFEAWSRRGGGGQRPLAALPEDAEAERRAITLLHALVAAAKADGHVDEEEQSAIEAEMEDLPEAARGLLRTALSGTVTPEEVAARVEGGQEAREVYAASALLSGRDHPGEVEHLDRLARALGLSDAEAREIEEGLHAV